MTEKKTIILLHPALVCFVEKNLMIFKPVFSSNSQNHLSSEKQNVQFSMHNKASRVCITDQLIAI